MKMKKYRIVLSSMRDGDGMFATPTPFKTIYVETYSKEKLQEFVESQEDLYGCKMVKQDTLFMGYHYTSDQGGAKVYDYVTPKEPEFQTL